MRQITVTGNLAADAEVKMSKQGNAYVQFRIGNHEYNEETTHWYNVTSNMPFHVNMAKYYKKGNRVIVVGDYSDDIYKSQRTGQCEISRDIRACAIYFNGDSKPRTEGQSTYSGTATTNASTAIQHTEVKEVNMATMKPTQSAKPTPTPTVVDDADDDLPF